VSDFKKKSSPGSVLWQQKSWAGYNLGVVLSGGIDLLPH